MFPNSRWFGPIGLISIFCNFLLIYTFFTFGTNAPTLSSSNGRWIINGTSVPLLSLCPSEMPTLSQEHADFIKSKRIYFAINFKNNENVIQHHLEQLMRVIQFVGSDKVFVSIYQSNSRDKTPDWLEVFKVVLDTRFHPPVKNKIVNEKNRNGVVGHKDRIPFLATVRNKAIAPLKGSSHQFDFVVFLNDVFYCMEDVIRLMLHDADLSCGLDFMPSDRHDNELTFYDTWVARDITGNKFDFFAPFVSDAESRQRISEGKPVSVQCCWNGMAVIRAAVFKDDDLRFRAPNVTRAGGQCAASECTIFCNDIWKNGHTKVILDPNVRVAYNIDIYRSLPTMKWITPEMNINQFSLHNLPNAGVDNDKFYRPKNPTPVFLCCPHYGFEGYKPCYNASVVTNARVHPFAPQNTTQ